MPIIINNMRQRLTTPLFAQGNHKPKTTCQQNYAIWQNHLLTAKLFRSHFSSASPNVLNVNEYHNKPWYIHIFCIPRMICPCLHIYHSLRRKTNKQTNKDRVWVLSNDLILPEFWMCIKGTKHLSASGMERERIVFITNSTPCLIKRPFILHLKNE